jgi:hypothetical protein
MLHLSLTTPTKHRRQQLVTMALNLTSGTIFSPKHYERLLLDQFAQGSLTIDQVLELLAHQEPA